MKSSKTQQAFETSREAIEQFENYIRYDMPALVNKAVQNKQKNLNFDSSVPAEYVTDVQDSKNDLPEKIYGIIESIMGHLLQTYNGYIEILNKAVSGEATLNDVNTFIPSRITSIYFSAKKELDEQYKDFISEKSS